MGYQPPKYEIIRQSGGLYYLYEEGIIHGPFSSYCQTKRAMKEMIKANKEDCLVMGRFDADGNEIYINH